MDSVLTREELAERWKFTKQTIDNMEREGKIKRIEGINGVRYSLAMIVNIEENGLAEISPAMIRKLQRENNELRVEIDRYRQAIRTIGVEVNTLIY